jgi:hypothetical protein
MPTESPAADVAAEAVAILREWPAFITAGALILTPEGFDADDPFPEGVPTLRLTPMVEGSEVAGTQAGRPIYRDTLALQVEANDPTGVWSGAALMAAEVHAALTTPDARDRLNAAGSSGLPEFPTPPDWDRPGRVLFYLYRRT